MRRDRTERPTDERELDAAYADGVAELSSDERHRVEARLAEDPAARAELVAVRGLLDRLRALPPEGNAPDWTALERAIRDAVGPVVPRPWWRRWTWMAPITTMVTAAVVLLLVWSRPAPRALIHRAVPAIGEHGEHGEQPAPAPDDDAVALWLDGAEVDVEPAAVDAFVIADDSDAAEADEVGLLPATDLAWVDNLDDEALDRAERWLAGKKG